MTDEYYFDNKNYFTSLDELVQSEEDLSYTSSYGKLAPLYEFVYKNHWSYKEQEELVLEHMNESSSKIIELGCGPGYLTGKLEEYFEKVYAVDYSNAMISLAKERTSSARLIQDGVHSQSLPDRVGCSENIVMLGRVFSNIFGENEVNKFHSNISKMLLPDGKLLFDFFEKKKLKNMSRDQSWETEKYRVRRQSTSKIINDNGMFEVTMEYTIHDKEKDKSKYASENFDLKSYSVKDIQEIFDIRKVRTVDEDSSTRTVKIS